MDVNLHNAEMNLHNDTINYANFYKGHMYTSQFMIYWMNLDKRRPAVIISNDWFNQITGDVIIAPMTSQDKSFSDCDREYSELYIPVIQPSDSTHDARIGYIDMTSIKVYNRNTIFKKDFIGILTDRGARERIITIMNNIVSPEYNSDHTSLVYQLSHRILETSVSKDSENEISLDKLQDNLKVMNDILAKQGKEIIKAEAVDTEVEDIENLIQDNQISTNETPSSSNVYNYKFPMRKDTFRRVCENISKNTMAVFDAIELSRLESIDTADYDTKCKIINSLAYILSTKGSDYVSTFHSQRKRNQFLDNLIRIASDEMLLFPSVIKTIKEFRHRVCVRTNFIDFIRRSK